MSTINFNGRLIRDLLAEATALAQNPPQGTKMQWWPGLSDLMGGLRPNELTILCAPTGAGKTELLANVAAQCILRDIPVFAAPVETGDLDFQNRISGCLAEMSMNSGEPVSNSDIESKLMPHMTRLHDSKTVISTHRNRVKVEDMLAEMTWFHQTQGTQVAILDNLNFFLEVTSSQNMLIEMDRAVHEFVIASQALPIHTILVMHPRKTDGGRIESEFDIKGSSTAVQEADNVLLFNKPKKEDLDAGIRKRNERELVFKKIRKRGWNTDKPIWMKFVNNRYQEVTDATLRGPILHVRK